MNLIEKRERRVEDRKRRKKKTIKGDKEYAFFYESHSGTLKSRDDELATSNDAYRLSTLYETKIKDYAYLYVCM